MPACVRVVQRSSAPCHSLHPLQSCPQSLLDGISPTWAVAHRVDQHVQLHKSHLSLPFSSLPPNMSLPSLPSLQAMRTPSRNEAGLELLMEYYNQLYFLDSRFFPPSKSLGVFFHWLVQLFPSHPCIITNGERGGKQGRDSSTVLGFP